jgi:N-acetylmuramoyl-L-alanine amidase
MKTVSICVGHSREGDNGAVSVSGRSEWNYNEPIAEMLAAMLRSAGVKVHVHDSYPGIDYPVSMKALSNALNVESPDCAIELHFNSASPNARGFEYLFWETSAKGRKLAQAFQSAHRERFPNQRDRGIKSIGFGQRGSLFLRLPNCPCLICEPFFGSSQDDWNLFGSEEGQSNLASMYATALADFLGVELRPQSHENGLGEAARKKRSQEMLERVSRLRVELNALEALIRYDA